MVKVPLDAKVDICISEKETWQTLTIRKQREAKTGWQALIALGFGGACQRSKRATAFQGPFTTHIRSEAILSAQNPQLFAKFWGGKKTRRCLYLRRYSCYENGGFILGTESEGYFHLLVPVNEQFVHLLYCVRRGHLDDVHLSFHGPMQALLKLGSCSSFGFVGPSCLTRAPTVPNLISGPLFRINSLLRFTAMVRKE